LHPLFCVNFVSFAFQTKAFAAIISDLQQRCTSTGHIEYHSYTIFCQMAALEPWVLVDFFVGLSTGPSTRGKNPTAVRGLKSFLKVK
jgi:hypothetical protein